MATKPPTSKPIVVILRIMGCDVVLRPLDVRDAAPLMPADPTPRPASVIEAGPQRYFSIAHFSTGIFNRVDIWLMMVNA